MHPTYAFHNYPAFQRSEGIPRGHDPKLKFRFQSCPRNSRNPLQTAEMLHTNKFISKKTKWVPAAMTGIKSTPLA
jgi:hypothetical protein